MNSKQGYEQEAISISTVALAAVEKTRNMMVMEFSDFNGILNLLRLHRSLLPSFTHKKVVNHSIKGDFVNGGSVDSANVKIIVDLLCVKSWERRGRERMRRERKKGRKM